MVMVITVASGSYWFHGRQCRNGRYGNLRIIGRCGLNDARWEERKMGKKIAKLHTVFQRVSLVGYQTLFSAGLNLFGFSLSISESV